MAVTATVLILAPGKTRVLHPEKSISLRRTCPPEIAEVSHAAVKIVASSRYARLKTAE
jgi:hypothetical protein